MSTALPCRAIRTSVLPRQYGLQRHRSPTIHRCVLPSASRAFSTTQTQCRSANGGGQDRAVTRAGARGSVGPAPRVNMEAAQREVGNMAEDIGLLQDTFVRAPFGQLPPVYSLGLWRYLWKMLRAKLTGIYTRCQYNRMLGNRGFLSYFPVDRFEHRQLKLYAKNYYVQIHEAFTNGDMATIRRYCLPPLARDFERRFASRGAIGMRWHLDESSWSARVVSHRTAVLGEDQPNTAYRQVIVRLQSMQRLKLTQKDSSHKKSEVPRWGPADVQRSQSARIEKQQEQTAFVESDQPKMVVDYIVLQKTLLHGEEREKWSIQGFAQESTVQRLEDDEAYWKKTMNAQASAAS